MRGMPTTNVGITVRCLSSRGVLGKAQANCKVLPQHVLTLERCLTWSTLTFLYGVVKVLTERWA
jgi:hypothetical protein